VVRQKIVSTMEEEERPAADRFPALMLLLALVVGQFGG
jgi:hypothetical protein